MVYNFPWSILRNDVRELEVGFYVRVGDRYGMIIAKNPFPVLNTFTAAASSKLTINFLDTDSNLGGTSGTISLRGYAGSVQKSPRVLMQYKYIAFGNSNVVTLKWRGKDTIPLYANVNFSAILNPLGDSSLTSGGRATPLTINRFSYDPSLNLQAIIDNTANAATTMTQDIVLDMVEYLFEDIASTAPVPTIYDLIGKDGYLFHVEGGRGIPPGLS